MRKVFFIVILTTLLPFHPCRCFSQHQVKPEGYDKNIIDRTEFAIPGSDTVRNHPSKEFVYNYTVTDDNKLKSIEIGNIFIENCSSLTAFDSLLEKLELQEILELKKDMAERKYFRATIKLPLNIRLDCLATMLSKIRAFTSYYELDFRSYEILVYGKNGLR